VKNCPSISVWSNSSSAPSLDAEQEGESSSQALRSGTGSEEGFQKDARPQANRSRKRSNRPKEIPLHEKDNLTNICVKFCAVDLRPFNVVNGDGFRHLAQALVNIGADHGKVDVESVLPHSSTISRKMHTVAERVREKFMPEVKLALENKTCSFDADMWSDKYTKTSYLTTTAQYVTSDFQLKSLVLFTTAFPADEKKTGENIRKYSLAALENLGITEDEIRDVTHITDEGANMLNAYGSNNRLSCIAHELATVLRHLFDDKFLSIHAPGIKSSLDAGKNIVAYLKRTGLCKLLPHSVRSLLETRWDSIVDMLFSICDAFPFIVKILRDRKEEHRLEGLDGELTTELIDILIDFKKVTKEIQSKKVPTIQYVVVRYHDLLKRCIPKDGDEDEDGDSEVCRFLLTLCFCAYQVAASWQRRSYRRAVELPYSNFGPMLGFDHDHREKYFKYESYRLRQFFRY